MDRLISVSIIRPIAVIAAVLMIVMFGGVALQSIPIQLTPDVNQPVITITTQWPGAAPAEVEREKAHGGAAWGQSFVREGQGAG